MRARHQIFTLSCAVLSAIFVALAGGAAHSALCQTPPAAPSQKAAANIPELAEADQLSLEIVKLYQAQKYDEALPLAKRALKLRETALGQKHTLVAESLTNLAEIYLANTKAAEAEPLLKRALTIYDKNPDSNGLIVGKTLDRLAALRLANADVKKAEEFYRRSLEVKYKAVGQHHAEVVFSMDRLADFYTGEKDYGKATPLLQQVASLREMAYGKSHLEVGLALERLACALYRNNEKAESERIEARANEILYSESAKKPEPFVLTPAMFDCRMITNPQVQIPGAAAGRASSYQMIVEVEVGEEGNVIKARMISGDPMFKKPSEQAALKAKFRPTLVNGRPAKFKGVIMHKYASMLIQRVLVGPVSRP